MSELKAYSKKITVLKFGSSVLKSKDDLVAVGHEIYRHWRRHKKIIVIVSAFANTTDELYQQAKEFEPNTTAAQHGLAQLVATGECSAASFLQLSLERCGVPTRSLQQPITTNSNALNAEPEYLRLPIAWLENDSVIITPGFVGVDALGETTLLGRGGSDFSALFIADKLYAQECILYKDVDGVYTQDPNKVKTALRYHSISFDDVQRVQKGLIQDKALAFAQQNNIRFKIKSLQTDYETHVGQQYSQVVSKATPSFLNVALLGLGTVGAGVYEYLKDCPDINITGILVTDISKHGEFLEQELLTESAAELLAKNNDVVIELIGGVEDADRYIRQALSKGCHVVTANKALIAAQGTLLRKQAKERYVELLYSAAVGGCLPCLEVIEQLKAEGITKISAVLNGTCNFILHQLECGRSFAEAIQQAKKHGFSESDPSLDINGVDAAEKIAIAAWHAFGQVPIKQSIQGISTIDEHYLAVLKKSHKKVRLLACCQLQEGKPVITVKPKVLAEDHSLAQTVGAENKLIIKTLKQSYVIQGLGAGCYPTAEAVFADLNDIKNLKYRVVQKLKRVI